MKHVKMLGLAAIAAAALMAFVGASTASASELCTGSPTCGTMYTEGTTIKSKLTSAVAELKAGFANVKCKKSTSEGTTSNTGEAGVNVKGPISALSFTECGVCSVSIVNLGELEVKATGGGNGELIGKSTETTINCLGVKCKYGTAAGGTKLGTVTGGNPAKFTASAELPYQAGEGDASKATCGDPGKWTAEYEIEAPKPLFVN